MNKNTDYIVTEKTVVYCSNRRPVQGDSWDWPEPYEEKRLG